MVEIKDYATLKERLTEGQLSTVKQILDHLKYGILRDDLRSEPGYRSIGIEDILLAWCRGDIQTYDFCEGVSDRLLLNGSPTDLGKAKAYDMLYKLD